MVMQMIKIPVRINPNQAMRPVSNPGRISLPWDKLFADFKFTPGSVPSAAPPEGYRESYEIALDWVSQNGWITPEHEDLALSIWLGQVDPLNYHGKPQEPVKASQPARSQPANVVPIIKPATPADATATPPAKPKFKSFGR